MSPDAHRMHMPGTPWPCDSPQLLNGSRNSARAIGTVPRVFAHAEQCQSLQRSRRRVRSSPHPDRNGNGEDQKRLNAAHEAWVQAVTAAKGRGRPHAAQWGGADAGGSGAMTLILPTEQGRPRQAKCKAFKKLCMEVARKRGAASRA